MCDRAFEAQGRRRAKLNFINIVDYILSTLSRKNSNALLIVWVKCFE